jgi:hypothetical protein
MPVASIAEPHVQLDSGRASVAVCFGPRVGPADTPSPLTSDEVSRVHGSGNAACPLLDEDEDDDVVDDVADDWPPEVPAPEEDPVVALPQAATPAATTVRQIVIAAVVGRRSMAREVISRINPWWGWRRASSIVYNAIGSPPLS